MSCTTVPPEESHPSGRVEIQGSEEIEVPTRGLETDRVPKPHGHTLLGPIPYSKEPLDIASTKHGQTHVSLPPPPVVPTFRGTVKRVVLPPDVYEVLSFVGVVTPLDFFLRPSTTIPGRRYVVETNDSGPVTPWKSSLALSCLSSLILTEPPPGSCHEYFEGLTENTRVR